MVKGSGTIESPIQAKSTLALGLGIKNDRPHGFASVTYGKKEDDVRIHFSMDRGKLTSLRGI
jgi:hypothetical protein